MFLTEITLNNPISSVWAKQLNCSRKNMTLKLYCTIFVSIFLFSLFVYGEQDCLQACTENPRCRSLNFKEGSQLHGKLLCELLDTDKFKSLKLFVASSDSHHFGVTVSTPIKKSYFVNIFVCVCAFCYLVRKELYLILFSFSSNSNKSTF